MEKHRPTLYVHTLAVVLLAAYLSRCHTDERAFAVVVLAASVGQIHEVVVAEEYAVHAVIVQTVSYGRHLRIVNHAD